MSNLRTRGSRFLDADQRTDENAVSSGAQSSYRRQMGGSPTPAGTTPRIPVFAKILRRNAKKLKREKNARDKEKHQHDTLEFGFVDLHQQNMGLNRSALFQLYEPTRIAPVVGSAPGKLSGTDPAVGTRVPSR